MSTVFMSHVSIVRAQLEKCTTKMYLNYVQKHMLSFMPGLLSPRKAYQSSNKLTKLAVSRSSALDYIVIWKTINQFEQSIR